MKNLIIKDKIYGTFKINEPVLIKLINSSALQRLKDVDNRGAWILHYSHRGK